MHAIAKIRVPAALDTERATRLADAIELCDARVIVLEGGDEVFCRGMDFTALVGLSEDTAIEVGVQAFARCIRAIRAAEAPVIAVVDGPALGGGLGIAAASDCVIATERAMFGLPEALFGLVPGVVLPVLRDRMSLHQARSLVLAPHARSATEAKELGLVDVIATDLHSTMRSTLRQFSRVKRHAVRSLRQLATETSALPVDAAIGRGADFTAMLLRSPIVRAAMRTYVDSEELPWE